ncbi:MAG: 30S ribosomal protein S9 [Nitrospinae bacterium]|nr:30S ribosomal protein S9 [Nitrospinota bacterium]
MISTEEKIYATGKRKEAIAKVWLQSGDGKIVVNNKDLSVYFARKTSDMIVKQPLEITNTLGSYDINATVMGGGLSGQAGALKLGISKALLQLDPDLRPVLKKAGFLTRDSRKVERKKYGQPGARKRFQFSKR